MPEAASSGHCAEEAPGELTGLKLDVTSCVESLWLTSKSESAISSFPGCGVIQTAGFREKIVGSIVCAEGRISEYARGPFIFRIGIEGGAEEQHRIEEANDLLFRGQPVAPSPTDGIAQIPAQFPGRLARHVSGKAAAGMIERAVLEMPKDRMAQALELARVYFHSVNPGPG